MRTCISSKPLDQLLGICLTDGEGDLQEWAFGRGERRDSIAALSDAFKLEVQKLGGGLTNATHWLPLCGHQSGHGQRFAWTV